MMHSGKEARVYCFCPSGDSESKPQRALPATRPRTSAFEVTKGYRVWGWAWNDGKVSYAEVGPAQGQQGTAKNSAEFPNPPSR
jgi:hypothetical protein